MKKILAAFFAVILGFAGYAFVFNPAVGANLVLILTDGVHTITGVQKITVTGGTVGGSGRDATVTISGGTSANPTATIGTAAVNGAASTFMRSDAAPSIPQCSSSTFGACKVDGSTITASGGVISSSGGTPANPTATIGTAAVNGAASTFMRSDAAPAIPQCSSSTFGACKVDGTTITASGGVISSAGGGGTVDWVSITNSVANGGHTVDPTGVADSTVGIQAAIDYAFAQGLTAVYCPNGTYKTSGTIYLDPPGNLRASFATPTMFQFTMAFFGDPKGAGALPLATSPTCQLQPTFNNAVAFIVGPGQGMRVSDIAVVGPNNAYRGNLAGGGVGIGIAGGNGGASNTLIRDTFVRYFQALYMTNANGGCCLADSNAFEHVGGSDGYYGIRLFGTQSFIDQIIEPVFGGVTIGIDDEYSHQTQVLGGNISATSSASAAFAITSPAAFNCGSLNLCVNATITSPDGNIPNVYDSFEILTTHFGVVPFKMTAWNAGTNVITLQALDIWERTNYGQNSYWSNNDIWSELNAATTLYASERVRTVKGIGVELDGTHVENAGACTTFFEISAVWTGSLSTEIRNPYFNYDTSLPQSATQANLYCQQSFPFIDNSQVDTSVRLSGGNWNPGEGSNYPLIFDTTPNSVIRGSQLNASGLFNFRFGETASSTSRAYGQIDTTDYQLATVARGIGVWDADYFLSTPTGVPETQWKIGELSVPFCGYEPCPSAVPNLSTSLYGLVGGSLGALGTYPPISCRTAFKSYDWNSGYAPTGLLRSASCPGWSWGQTLNDASVGHTVTWSYSRGSSDLYVDANTIKWMFPGLGFAINNGDGPQPYIVTGVYPYLGYVTVIWAGNNTGNAGGNSVGMQGNNDQIYSCASSCSITQAAFVWGDNPPGWVQGNETNFPPGPLSTRSVTLTSQVGYNHCIVGVVNYVNASPVITSITDDQGNAYTILDQITDGSNSRLASYYLCGIKNHPQTLTVALSSSSTNFQIIADEEAGHLALDSAVTPHAGQFQATPGTGTDGVTSGSITTVQNGDTIWAATYVLSPPSLLTPGTGFTKHGDTETFSEVRRMHEDKTQVSAGAVSGTFTEGSASGTLTVAVALH